MNNKPDRYHKYATKLKVGNFYLAYKYSAINNILGYKETFIDVSVVKLVKRTKLNNHTYYFDHLDNQYGLCYFDYTTNTSCKRWRCNNGFIDVEWCHSYLVELNKLDVKNYWPQMVLI